MLESILSDDGTLCVDFFEDPVGGYGFEHLRTEPEDVGRWSVVGGFSSARYDSALDAATAAHTAVEWLGHDRAMRSWQGWCSYLRSI